MPIGMRFEAYRRPSGGGGGGTPESYFLPTFTSNLTEPGSPNLGMTFTVAVPGTITHIRFFKAANEGTGARIGRIYLASNNSVLASVTWSGETASGWQQMALASPLAISAGTQYRVGVNSFSNFAIIFNSTLVPGTRGNITTIDGRFGSTLQTGVGSEHYLRDIVFVPS